MTVTKEDLVQLARFRAALRRFVRFSEVRARAAGITPQQHQLLLAVMGAAPGRNWVTVTEVAAALQINHNAAVGLAQRAEAAGLVVRSAHPEDRRIICIAVTEQGEAVLTRLSAEHKRELERLGPLLTDLLGRLGHAAD